MTNPSESETVDGGEADFVKFARWLADKSGVSLDDCPPSEQEKWLWDAEAITSEVLRRAARSERVDGLSDEEVEAAAKAIQADQFHPKTQRTPWAALAEEHRDLFRAQARAALTAAATLRPPREAEGRYREALERLALSIHPPVAAIARQALPEQPSEGARDG